MVVKWWWWWWWQAVNREESETGEPGDHWQTKPGKASQFGAAGARARALCCRKNVPGVAQRHHRAIIITPLYTFLRSMDLFILPKPNNNLNLPKLELF